MTEPAEILKIINQYFEVLSKNKKLKVLVTAGPTIETIDPVRFISNRSSGKQGYEIAKAFVNNGYDTTLISGPTNLKPPMNVKLIKINSADQMFEQTINNLPVDVAIFSAAVSDFKVDKISNNKIKKNRFYKFEYD